MENTLMQTDIFNLSSDNLLKPEGKNSLDIFYHPNAKDGKNNVYQASLKFLPNIFDPNKCIVSKWVVWVTNPRTEEKKLVDCPSTIQQPSILHDIYKELFYKSDSAVDKKLAANFQRRETFFSLVEILQDPQHPEYEGQIKIFKFGRKIYNKLRGVIKPDNDMIEPNNPFDLFEGKPFMLKVTLVSDFNNFDESTFIDKARPFAIPQFNEDGLIKRSQDGKGIRKPIERDPKNFKIIEEYLREKSPNICDYDYKPWDDETYAFVISSIQNTLPSGRLIEKIFAKYQIQPNVSSIENEIKPKLKSTKKQSLSIDLNIDEGNESLDETDELDEIDKYLNETKTVKATSQKTNKTVKKVTPIIDEEDDIDLSQFDDDDDDM